MFNDSPSGLLTADSVDDLISLSAEWAERQYNGVLNARTVKGAHNGCHFLLRSGRDGRRVRTHEGLQYDAIEISRITLPPKLQKKGVFTQLASALADTGKYGILWVDKVQDDAFGKALLQRGFLPHQEDGLCSYYKVIGEPVSSEIQRNNEEGLREVERRAKNLKQFRLGKTKRKKMVE